ncbi:MAG: hypothetical protein QOJ12_1621 [Thermoleophilales bacterium]|nr:hypothetical protein [Thermoleophilales bacterium]
MRRIIGIGGVVLLLILLVFLVKSCRSAQKTQAFKDYVRDVGAFVQVSDDQSTNLFKLLQNGGQTPVELQNTVNGYASEAAQLVDRAKGASHPGELDGAHRYLVETLEFRRDGLKGIAADLPRALGDRGQQATQNIAAQMQNFLASDVIYSQRFRPRAEAALKTEGLAKSETVPRSAFLPDVDWLIPATVADRISRIASGGTGTGGPVAPGLHGTGLGTVTVQPGGAALVKGGATQIKGAPNLSLAVQVVNQGENDEKNVKVRVSMKGTGKPIVLEATLASIARGQTKTVNVPLSSTPPTGQPVTISIEVLPVPGEKKTDNNKATFQAVFTK